MLITHQFFRKLGAKYSKEKAKQWTSVSNEKGGCASKKTKTNRLHKLQISMYSNVFRRRPRKDLYQLLETRGLLSQKGLYFDECKISATEAQERGDNKRKIENQCQNFLLSKTGHFLSGLSKFLFENVVHIKWPINEGV